MGEYTTITYKVIWYAETGWIDGSGRGLWIKTESSEPFPTKAEAEAHLESRPDVKRSDKSWRAWESTHSYGVARIRRVEEVLQGD